MRRLHVLLLCIVSNAAEDVSITNVTLATTNTSEHASSATTINTTSKPASAATINTTSKPASAPTTNTTSEPASAATTNTTSEPYVSNSSETAEAEAWLAVENGSLCTVQTSSNFSCAQTHNFPKNYGNNETCTFKILRTGKLTAVPFRTEKGFDILIVDDKEYSGHDGPLRIHVVPGSNVTFHSDASVSHGGFQLCLGLDVENEGFIISENSHCALSTEPGKDGSLDPCVTSRNYPKHYFSGDECHIWTQKEGYMYFVAFTTEPVFDVLTVENIWSDGKPAINDFSGTSKPSNLKVGANAKITWKTDDKNDEEGWKLCYTETPLELLPLLTEKPSAAPIETATKASVEPAELVFSIHVMNRWVDKLDASIVAVRNEGDVKCMVLDATQGFSWDTFDTTNDRVLRIHVYPDMPALASTLHFTQTVSGMRLSAAQYRIACRGPNMKVETKIVMLKQRSGHKKAEEAIPEGRADNRIYPMHKGIFSYLLVVACGILLCFCVSTVLKRCRSRFVDRIEYEMELPEGRGNRADGYVPPQMVGFSGDII